MVGVLGSLLVLPVNFLWIFFFRYSRVSYSGLNLATGRERQMTTGGPAGWSGSCSNFTIFEYLHCARCRQVRFPLSC